MPEEDTLSVLPGFIGSYPNAFFEVDLVDVGTLVSAIETLRSGADYSVLLDTWGIRRTDPEFWKRSDDFQLAYQQRYRIDGGILDFSRLENR